MCTVPVFSYNFLTYQLHLVDITLDASYLTCKDTIQQNLSLVTTSIQQQLELYDL